MFASFGKFRRRLILFVFGASFINCSPLSRRVPGKSVKVAKVGADCSFGVGVGVGVGFVSGVGDVFLFKIIEAFTF